MKKKRGKSFLKRYKFVIIISSIIGLGILTLFLPILSIKNYDRYQSYYQKACEVQEEYNNYQDRINWTTRRSFMQNEKGMEYGKFLKMCMDTGGCYDLCGSSCPPKQEFKSSIVEYIMEKRTMCTADCNSQCACPLGTEFDSEKGCI